LNIPSSSEDKNIKRLIESGDISVNGNTAKSQSWMSVTFRLSGSFILGTDKSLHEREV